jgi:hypothetical protein
MAAAIKDREIEDAENGEKLRITLRSAIFSS